MRQRGRARRLARVCAVAFATAIASPLLAAASDEGGAAPGSAGAPHTGAPGAAADAGGAGGLATDGGSPERYDVDPAVVPPGVVLFSNPGESGAPGPDWTARGDGACAAGPTGALRGEAWLVLLLVSLAAARRRRG